VVNDEREILIVQWNPVGVSKRLGITGRARCQHRLSRGLEGFVGLHDPVAMTRLHAVKSRPALGRHRRRIENDVGHRTLQGVHQPRNHESTGGMGDNDDGWLEAGALHIGDDRGDLVVDCERTQIMWSISPAW
jgi:hypothetical protein